MGLKTLQWRIEYAGVRLVGAVMAALPLAAASAFSGWGWRTIGPLTRRHRRTLDHIACALPELDGAARRRVALDMWETLGRTFGEFFHLEEIVATRLRFRDPAAIEAFRARGGGAMLCSMHLGNWEAVAGGTAALGLRAAGVYQRLTNPFVDAFVTRRRLHIYPGGLLPKAPDTGRRLMKHARAGGAIALLADLRDRRGVSVPFFGRPAPSTPFPALMARQLDLPILVARALRLPGPFFEIDFVEIPVARGGDRDADVATTTAAIQAALEAYIRQAPGQWMWAHRRWG